MAKSRCRLSSRAETTERNDRVMRIRLNTLMAGPRGVFQPGAVVEVPESVARALIIRGATALDELDEPVAETATLEPRNSGRRRRKRR